MSILTPRDFQPGSFGYRPKKSAQDAIRRVSEAILTGKTYVIDLDLRSYFDTVRHHIVLGKVANRINDDKVMQLLKLILKASGRRGVPQGGVTSPLISNVYLNEVDKMLEQAKTVVRYRQWSSMPGSLTIWSSWSVPTRSSVGYEGRWRSGFVRNSANSKWR